MRGDNTQLSPPRKQFSCTERWMYVEQQTREYHLLREILPDGKTPTKVRVEEFTNYNKLYVFAN